LTSGVSPSKHISSKSTQPNTGPQQSGALKLTP
jgi:hypothetical protein